MVDNFGWTQIFLSGGLTVWLPRAQIINPLLLIALKVSSVMGDCLDMKLGEIPKRIVKPKLIVLGLPTLRTQAFK